MCVNASNERVAPRGADSIYKGFQEPIVVGVGAAKERRILGEIKGDAALEEESSCRQRLSRVVLEPYRA
jgi:hypothetical protein